MARQPSRVSSSRSSASRCSSAAGRIRDTPYATWPSVGASVHKMPPTSRSLVSLASAASFLAVPSATPSEEHASCTTKFCDVFCRSEIRTWPASSPLLESTDAVAPARCSSSPKVRVRDSVWLRSAMFVGQRLAASWASL